MTHRISRFFGIIVLCLTAAGTLSANDRRFTYTYESSVMPLGVRELEIWNTYRRDRSYFYRRLDQRVEFEFGLGGNLQTSLYLNTEWTLFDDRLGSGGGTATSKVGASISSEWKLKLMDRVADPVGFALYGEWTLGLDETEVEGKLIFDKQSGPLLYAMNVVGEHEWETGFENGVEEVGREFTLEIDGGCSYEVAAQFALGLEARNVNTYKTGNLEISALFAGPVVSYTGESWWATLTVLPQLTAFKGATSGGLNLDDHEKVDVRLLLSYHL